MGSRFLTLTRGFLDRRTPGYMIFFVTPFCDCRCPMCFNRQIIEQAASRKTLTFDEIETISRKFTGLHHVNFSGGEPFLRNDFAQIPELFYRNSGTRIFACPTNSSRPAKIVEAVRTICASCPDAWVRITQSLDGIGSDHDTIRGKPGLFDCVVELNQELARLRPELPNLSVGIATVMSKYNAGKEYDLLDYVYDHLEFDDFGALYVRGDTHDPDARDIDANSYVTFMETARKRARSKKKQSGFTGKLFSAINATSTDLLMRSIQDDCFVTYCRAGKNMVVMNDEGTITPCEVLEHFIHTGRATLNTAVLGNIREYDYDIRKLLNTDHARSIINYIHNSRCYCSFECAMAVNVLYSPHLWPGILKHLKFSDTVSD